MSSASRIVHAAPAGHPTSVRQIADRLFPAYTVDNGTVQLAGCLLEDRLFVQFDFRASGQEMTIRLDADGQEVDRCLADVLGLDEFTELQRPPRPFAEKSHPSSKKIEQLTEQARRLASESLPREANLELVATRVLWCKFAQGKLRFVVEGSSVDLAFADWSCLLKPPPFVCPHTNSHTFHLASTDDGRIAAADQVAVCEETGRRVLIDELETCSVTGRRVVAQQMAHCSVTGDRVLRQMLVVCPTCRQSVSPTIIVGKKCSACGGVEPVDRDDPRLARVIDKYPMLDRWKRWRMSQSVQTCVLVGCRGLSCLLIVIDSDSVELKHMAVGKRLLGGWLAVEPSRYEEVMHG